MTEANTGERLASPQVTIGDADYWYAQINEKVAAAFLDLQTRTLQAYRQRGSGPQYISLSARCVRYRRIDLQAWANERLRRSTADPGQPRPTDQPPTVPTIPKRRRKSAQANGQESVAA